MVIVSLKMVGEWTARLKAALMYSESWTRDATQILLRPFRLVGENGLFNVP